ncbi:MAG: copper homeostasis protein CutC [Lachnospiraceae bacterium]|nr:copper homeostasis protein CutC [Lachnospiraceae bacterium]
MKEFTLEVCADSVESVLAAERGGASRIELCQNLVIGGTTPSPCLFREIRNYSDIRIHILIRPRYGDFCYSDYEFAMMQEEIQMFRELGAQGVVIGILKPNGTLNTDQLKTLMEKARGMSVTLHRAFDVCADPFEAMEQAIDLGFSTILTSGQKNNCLEGAGLLRQLVEQSRGRIQIQAGAGVDADAIETLYRQTGIRAYHLSGKTTLNSEMKYRKEGVSMGLPEIGEFEILRTDEEKVREARRVLEQLGSGNREER